MSAKHESVTRTQDELQGELERRFGPDPMKWAFQCPACRDIATGQDFKDALAEHPREDGSTASDHLGRMCIGRLIGALSGGAADWEGRGCDWASFGLFSGPDFVQIGDTKVPCFALAPELDHTHERDKCCGKCGVHVSPPKPHKNCILR
jgi:hypothetical protein